MTNNCRVCNKKVDCCGQCGVYKDHTEFCYYTMYLDSWGEDYKEQFEHHEYYKPYNDMTKNEIEEIFKRPEYLECQHDPHPVDE